jgi:hypothetical protein
LEALTEWRDLLGRAGVSVPRDVALGLTGELEVLSRLGRQHPLAALNAWTGPSRSTHDFVHGGHHIEVKSTASVDGQTVRVSNIDQLDASTASEGLHLLVVHCAVDPAASDLDSRIRDLIASGFPRTRLIKTVADYGYVFESGQAAPVFAVRSIRLWPVDDAFPGLRAADLPASRRSAVLRLSYDLSLSAAPSPMSETEMQEVLAGWLEL